MNIDSAEYLTYLKLLTIRVFEKPVCLNWSDSDNVLDPYLSKVKFEPS